MSVPPTLLADLDGQVVIIIIAMVIGGIQWLVERIKKSKRGNEEPVGTDFEDLYEEARREIQDRQARQYPTQQEVRERLGPSTPPGVPPVRSVAPPVIPTGPVRRPSIPTSAPPPIPGMPPGPRKPVRPTLSKAEKEALQRLQARQAKGRGKSRRTSRSRSRVRALLSSPSSARDAIVLSEILGPPKGAA